MNHLLTEIQNHSIFNTLNCCFHSQISNLCYYCDFDVKYCMILLKLGEIRKSVLQSGLKLGEIRKSVLQSGGPALRFVKHFATTSNKARQLLGFQ